MHLHLAAVVVVAATGKGPNYKAPPPLIQDVSRTYGVKGATGVVQRKDIDELRKKIDSTTTICAEKQIVPT